MLVIDVFNCLYLTFIILDIVLHTILAIRQLVYGVHSFTLQSKTDVDLYQHVKRSDMSQ